MNKRILHAAFLLVVLLGLSISSQQIQRTRTDAQIDVVEDSEDVLVENNVLPNTSISYDIYDDIHEIASLDHLISESNTGSDLKEGTKYINNTSVNIRSFPTKTGEVIGKLNTNDVVELLVTTPTGYCQIQWGDVIGFVHKDYLSDTKVVVKPTTKPSSQFASITDDRERVVAIAKSNKGTRPCTAGWCAAWVSGIYEAAGLGYPGGNAIDYWTRWSDSGSTSMDNIPLGAVVVGSGSGSAAGNKYGHVAIYIGNGMVADNVGYHRIISLEQWAAKQVGTCNGYHGYIGWVWPYGEEL
jgi:uncharacterized protein YgiM (DUF1202 family)